jgi:anaphase-promoting complex subunit 6
LTTELFYFAHTQVKQFPKEAVSWYAVGAYYYSAKRFDTAVRYFSKATALAPSVLVGWISAAHAHAMNDESDRAMALYRTAARLFPGSHLPILGTALEYLRTNNVTLAEQFCHQALSICSTDPGVYNELGVVFYRKKRFLEAAKYFEKAIDSASGVSERVFSLSFEHLYFNLGHALRRGGRLQAAVTAYDHGLARSPKNSSGHAALGLTYHILGEIDKALDEYHVALGLSPNDSISHELMELAAREVVLTDKSL